MTTSSGDHDPMLQHVLLTSMAIIQGVALTELLVAHLFEFPTTMTLHGWLRPLQGLALLQLIVFTWHGQLTTMIGHGLWPKTYFGILDSCFPFALGVVEVQLIHVRDEPRLFCAWLAVFFGLVCAAYADMYRKLAVRYSGQPDRFGPRFERHKRLNLSLSALTALLFGVLAGVSPDLDHAGLFVAVNGVVFSFVFPIRSAWNDLKSLPQFTPEARLRTLVNVRPDETTAALRRQGGRKRHRR